MATCGMETEAIHAQIQSPTMFAKHEITCNEFPTDRTTSSTSGHPHTTLQPCRRRGKELLATCIMRVGLLSKLMGGAKLKCQVWCMNRELTGRLWIFCGKEEVRRRPSVRCMLDQKVSSTTNLDRDKTVIRNSAITPRSPRTLDFSVRDRDAALNQMGLA